MAYMGFPSCITSHKIGYGKNIMKTDYRWKNFNMIGKGNLTLRVLTLGLIFFGKKMLKYAPSCVIVVVFLVNGRFTTVCSVSVWDFC